MRCYTIKGDEAELGFDVDESDHGLITRVGDRYVKLLEENEALCLEDDRLLAGEPVQREGHVAIRGGGNDEDILAKVHTGLRGGFAEALGYEPEGDSYEHGVRQRGSYRQIKKLVWGRENGGRVELIQLEPGATAEVKTDLGNYLVSNTGDLSVVRRY